MKTKALPLALALLAAALPVHAQERPATPRVVVTGEGTASAPPDLATLTLGVMREAPSATEALDGSSRAMADVIAALKALGIATRDLQTAGLQITPRYEYKEYPDRPADGRIVAYQVSNTLQVRARDVGRVGEIIDRAVSLGVNTGGEITFANDDPKAVLLKAREAAVADATAKARTLAAAAGVELGPVVEITDTMMSAPPQPFLAAKAAEASDAVPIERGENSYRVEVGMVFELK